MDEENVRLDDLSERLYHRGLTARPGETESVRLLLERYLTSSSHQVRYGAVMGLSYVGTKATIPVVEQAWEREENGIVRSLMQSLIRWLRSKP